jgi:SAM-dependent methyltransferase
MHPRDIFKGTASYYARYRPGYPEPFLAYVARRFGLDGRGRLLDLGCGSGQLALPLAPHFEEVLGLDPEPEMLREAEAAAARTGTTNARFLEAGSQDLGRLRSSLGRFRLVTMGASFHWMDRGPTLKALYEMVEPGGGLVISWLRLTANNPQNEWMRVADAVIKRHLGQDRRAGSAYYVEQEETHEQVIARSPFRRMEVISAFASPYIYQQRRDIEGITGWLYSTSYANPSVLGPLREPFEQDLRETLLDLQPSGQFEEEVYVGAILAWKDTGP